MSIEQKFADLLGVDVSVFYSYVYITNNTDDSARITSFRLLTNGIEFTMDGNTNYISGNNYTKFYDKNFIRFISGTNNIGIVGNVSKIKFEWSNRKYL